MYKQIKSTAFNLLLYLSRAIHFSYKDNIILCYHSINDKDSWEFSLKSSEFEKQLIQIQKHRKIVDLNKLISSKKKSSLAAITFDDGYQDVYLNAFPILKKLGLTATLFVNEVSKGNRKLMTVSQVKKLIASGWNIGYHTKTHVKNTYLNANELRKEISPKVLEKKLGIKINSYAYPYGAFNNFAMRIIGENFRYAYTVSGGSADTKDLLQIPRVTISSDISIKLFQVYISSPGIMLNKYFEKILSICTK